MAEKTMAEKTKPEGEETEAKGGDDSDAAGMSGDDGGASTVDGAGQNNNNGDGGNTNTSRYAGPTGTGPTTGNPSGMHGRKPHHSERNFESSTPSR